MKKNLLQINYCKEIFFNEILNSQIDPPSLLESYIYLISRVVRVLHRIILHREEGSWKKQSCRIGEQRRDSIVAKVASRFLNSYLTPTLFLVPRGGGGRGEGGIGGGGGGRNEEDRSNEWDKEEESETRICKYGTFRF